MAIVSKDRMNRRIEIDLTGPQGNTYCMLYMADQYGKQMGKSPEEREALQGEMTSGDYENLVAVFDREFGSFVDLLR